MENGPISCYVFKKPMAYYFVTGCNAVATHGR